MVRIIFLAAFPFETLSFSIFISAVISFGWLKVRAGFSKELVVLNYKYFTLIHPISIRFASL